MDKVKSDLRKGVIVNKETYLDLLLDPAIRELLIFNKNGDVLIDFGKYCNLGYYLPIMGCYSKGWDFLQALNDCKYRTQDNFIYIIEKPTNKHFKLVKKRIPVYQPLASFSENNNELDTCSDMPFVEVEDWVIADNVDMNHDT